MFSYTDSVFQTTNSPTKELKFEDLQHHQHPRQSTLDPNSYPSSNGPLYPYNDMLYYQQPMSSSYDMSTPSSQPRQAQPQRWQDPTPSQQQQQQQHHHQQQQQQLHNPTFYPDIRNQSQPVVDHSSSYDHYSSPFSSPIPNNNITSSTPSQRSSLQSLPSVPPIPSSSNSPSGTQRLRITTSLWDDEGTVCYQVDVRGICVARRQDNDMVNGTKLLNVTGMSRGKRDGILKNEKGRVVVKVGAMHLKGVWVTFARAKALAIQFNIADHLHPLFVDDPAMYFYSNQLTSHNYYIPNHPIYLQSQDAFGTQQQQQQQQQVRASPSNSSTTNDSHVNILSNNTNENYMQTNSFSTLCPNNSSNDSLAYAPNNYQLPSAPPVPSMIPVQPQMPMYGYPSNSQQSQTTPPNMMHHYN